MYVFTGIDALGCAGSCPHHSAAQAGCAGVGQFSPAFKPLAQIKPQITAALAPVKAAIKPVVAAELARGALEEEKKATSRMYIYAGVGAAAVAAALLFATLRRKRA